MKFEYLDSDLSKEIAGNVEQLIEENFEVTAKVITSGQPNNTCSEELAEEIEDAIDDWLMDEATGPNNLFRR